MYTNASGDKRLDVICELVKRGNVSNGVSMEMGMGMGMGMGMCMCMCMETGMGTGMKWLGL